eukprot:scaffold2136_cov170-Ochromonas_danica.AAC.7
MGGVGFGCDMIAISADSFMTFIIIIFIIEGEGRDRERKARSVWGETRFCIALYCSRGIALDDTRLHPLTKTLLGTIGKQQDHSEDKNNDN